MKERANKVLKIIGTIFILGLLYGIFVMYTGIGVPCVFKLITGYDCPGCGVSRMCLALMKFDFCKAFRYNKMLFIITPILLIVFAYQLYRYIWFNQTRLTKVQSAILYIAIALLLIWGVIRNI